MRIADYVRFALKNIRRQRLRSVLTVVAVVIGSVLITVMLSVVSSVNSAVRKQMESVGQLTEIEVRPSAEWTEGGAAQESPGSGGKKLDDAVVQAIGRIPNVRAVSPEVFIGEFTSVRLEGAAKRLWPDLAAYEPDTALDKKLSAGRELKSDDIARVLIGGDKLKGFGYEKNPQEIVGKKVIFTTRKGYTGYGVEAEPPPMGGDREEHRLWEERRMTAVHEVPAEIVGVISGIGNNGIYTTMRWAREIKSEQMWEGTERGPVLRMKGFIEQMGYESVIVKVDRTDNVKEVTKAIEGMGLGARSAEDVLNSLSNVTVILGTVLGGIGFIALLVAAIGIINTMVMAIFERTREIGVMRASGATRGTIRRLFTFEAAILGFLGGAMGIAVSFVLYLVGNYVANRVLASHGATISNVVSLPPWLAVGVILFTTLIGLLAGLYPASRAARMDPVEALRYE